MRILLIFLLFLLETRGGVALNCISCLYLGSENSGTQGLLELIYRDAIDSRCAKLPSEINATVPCSGSCIFSRASAYINRSPLSPVTITYRGCSPVPSANEGCWPVLSDEKDRNTTMKDQKSLQAILDYTWKGGRAVQIVENLNGTLCSCNSDGCNAESDLSEPDVQVPPETQCHECAWMEVTSSDPRADDSRMPQQSLLDVRCSNDTANVPLVSCTGSCVVTEVRVNMSITRYPRSEESVVFKGLKRQCAGLQARDQCQTLSDKDGPSFYQFLAKAIKDQKQMVGPYFNAELTSCTCNKDGCNSKGVTSLEHEHEISAASCQTSLGVLGKVLVLVALMRFFC